MGIPSLEKVYIQTPASGQGKEKFCLPPRNRGFFATKNLASRYYCLLSDFRKQFSTG